MRDADGDALAVAVAENVIRADLNPVEEARAYERLLAEHGDRAKVAKLVGRSEKLVGERLDLLRLPDEAQQLLAARRVPLACAPALIRIAEGEPLLADLDGGVARGAAAGGGDLPGRSGRGRRRRARGRVAGRRRAAAAPGRLQRRRLPRPDPARPPPRRAVAADPREARARTARRSRRRTRSCHRSRARTSTTGRRARRRSSGSGPASRSTRTTRTRRARSAACSSCPTPTGAAITATPHGRGRALAVVLRLLLAQRLADTADCREPNRQGVYEPQELAGGRLLAKLAERVGRRW